MILGFHLLIVGLGLSQNIRVEVCDSFLLWVECDVNRANFEYFVFLTKNYVVYSPEVNLALMVRVAGIQELGFVESFFNQSFLNMNLIQVQCA